MTKPKTETKPIEMRTTGEFYSTLEIHHLYIHGKTDKQPYILEGNRTYERNLWGPMDTFPGTPAMKQFLSLSLKDIDLDFFLTFNTKLNFGYAKVAFVDFIIRDKKLWFKWQLQLTLRKMPFNPIIYIDYIGRQIKDTERSNEQYEFIYPTISIEGTGKMQHLFDRACSKLNHTLQRAEAHAVKFMKTY